MRLSRACVSLTAAWRSATAFFRSNWLAVGGGGAKESDSECGGGGVCGGGVFGGGVSAVVVGGTDLFGSEIDALLPGICGSSSALDFVLAGGDILGSVIVFMAAKGLNGSTITDAGTIISIVRRLCRCSAWRAGSILAIAAKAATYFVGISFCHLFTASLSFLVTHSAVQATASMYSSTA